MSTPAIDLLRDGFDRVRETATAAVQGLDDAALTHRVGPEANSIAWLVWHLARVQDDHVADVAGTEQVWTAAGWAGRFAVPFDEGAIGYGQSSDEVAAVRGIAADDLIGYLVDVHTATGRYLETLEDADLDRVVDEDWDPPVTLATRLVSVISDDLQHAGQAAFVRGLL
ncbi:DUF664 domain-containing protein [Jatrophihabitans endophyticus]|uniref:mycothiol transferase n=1 Tax=Jatrophihabitans endophyticus TaxID=1206085 RepID=UPI0019FD2B06|nr:DUF664 domain-containing protein [Jatrophihabitans endophyticus]MBE7187820.1 DUF664 domain-containing protein [Jatrophihabitans endophyticus]